MIRGRTLRIRRASAPVHSRPAGASGRLIRLARILRIRPRRRTRLSGSRVAPGRLRRRRWRSSRWRRRLRAALRDREGDRHPSNDCDMKKFFHKNYALLMGLRP